MEVCKKNYENLMYLVYILLLCGIGIISIDRIIISPDFKFDYSINTIFQLLSRCGRNIKNWISDIYINDHIKNKIIKYCNNELDNDIEIKNMLQMLDYINKININL